MVCLYQFDFFGNLSGQRQWNFAARRHNLRDILISGVLPHHRAHPQPSTRLMTPLLGLIAPPNALGPATNTSLQ
jgi:hypothetical protein